MGVPSKHLHTPNILLVSASYSIVCPLSSLNCQLYFFSATHCLDSLSSIKDTFSNEKCWV